MQIVTIVGGGFSGTLLLANLVFKAKTPISINLLDKSGIFGKGLAYITQDPTHLLNVRAGLMGALAEDSGHFYKWLQNHEKTWRDLDPKFSDLEIDENSFVPRKIYSRYLKAMLDLALETAKQKNILVALVKNEAVSASFDNENRLDITLATGEVIKTDSLVLATGVECKRSLMIEGSSERCIMDMWKDDPNNLLFKSDLSHLAKTTELIILGSGLTMIDALMSINDKGYQGNVTIVSRSGKVPYPHQVGIKPYPPFLDIKTAPKNALALLKSIRQEIKKTEENGYNWRAVIDSLRPVTVSLWEGLPRSEKVKFLRYLFDVWNRHRHRIPPESFANFQEWVDQGRISHVKGFVTKIVAERDRSINVHYSSKSKVAFELKGDYVINCLGFEYDIRKTKQKIILALQQAGLVQFDPLFSGLSVDSRYHCLGSNHGKIFAVGHLLFGDKLETVAVPELRAQVEVVAKELL